MMFSRLARIARRCVEAAVEEARWLGHDSVGDEDLLLGVLHTGEGLGAEALSSVGISLDEVRRGAGGAFEMRIPDDRRIPFSPRAKKALEGALHEAIRLQDNRITDEHVLRGLLREEDGTAVRLLGNLGVTPASLEERLDQLRGRAA